MMLLLLLVVLVVVWPIRYRLDCLLHTFLQLDGAFLCILRDCGNALRTLIVRHLCLLVTLDNSIHNLLT